MTRKTVANCIEKIGSQYRCRVTFKGRRFSHYESSLQKAKTWVRNVRNGVLTPRPNSNTYVTS